MMQKMLYRFVKPQNVVRIQRHYIKHFLETHAATVLDVGCGRGLFLNLLRQAGIHAHGLDTNPEAVSECKKQGFENVSCEDAVEGLERRLRDGLRYDGVFCSHVIEHLPGASGVRLIELCAKVLSPGGRLLVTTPNVANLRVWTHVFWLDPTHVRPYPRQILSALATDAGLRVIRAFADPHTRSGFRHLVWDLFRYGISTLAGLDNVLLAEVPRDSSQAPSPR